MIRIRALPLAIAGIAVLFAGIFGASIAGFWKTTSTKEPAKIKEGEFAGLPSPSDIRGSYTWLDIEKAFGVPADEISAAFGSASADLKVNSLEAEWAGKLPAGLEIGTDSVRLFVALYTGLPHEAGEGTVLPDSAIAALEKAGKADETVLAAYRVMPSGDSSEPDSGTTAGGDGASAKKDATPVSSAVAEPEPSSAPEAEKSGSAPASEAHETTPGTISGATTFGELKDWGAAEEDIRKILDGQIGGNDEAIKDFVSGIGLKFGEVKTELQALLD